jgi:hypothetical protein
LSTNIGLIIGVVLAIAVLLGMLVYVVIKWTVPTVPPGIPVTGQTSTPGFRPAVAGRLLHPAVNGNGVGEKSAMMDFGEYGDMMQHHHGRSPPLYSDSHGSMSAATTAAIFDNGGKSPVGVQSAIFVGGIDSDGTIKTTRDVKEWFV